MMIFDLLLIIYGFFGLLLIIYGLLLVGVLYHGYLSDKERIKESEVIEGMESNMYVYKAYVNGEFRSKIYICADSEAKADEIVANMDCVKNGYLIFKA